ncbi:MAG: serine hydrolase [Chloroflexi bacterium]|nr:serine hydrolase [Chloroflexota bacterium]
MRQSLPAQLASRQGSRPWGRPLALTLAVGLALLTWLRLHDGQSTAMAAAPPIASQAAIVPHPISRSAIAAGVESRARGILDDAGGTTAMVAAMPGQAPFVALNANAALPSASLYKLGVMAAVYNAFAKGNLTPSQQTTVTQEDVDTYGDAPATAPGTVVTVQEALQRMITVSDNSAAGALIDLVGESAVDAAFAANGMPGTHLGSPSSGVAETTAADQAAFFQRLLDGQVVSRTASQQMIQLLEGQQENDRLPAKLPPGTIVAHKTGELDGVRNDSGIIFTPAGPVICVVLVSDQPEGGRAVDAIADLGLLVFQAVS